MPTKTIKPFKTFFFRKKRNKKTRPLPPQQRGDAFVTTLLFIRACAIIILIS
uniref:Uncharacterized protein n=1 Tax=Actinobacillus sp. TaxID=41114 RepID=A0A894T721_9PAST|nr:hypothetical protein [Actinobacillus sp.]